MLLGEKFLASVWAKVNEWEIVTVRMKTLGGGTEGIVVTNRVCARKQLLARASRDWMPHFLSPSWLRCARSLWRQNVWTRLNETEYAV